MQLEIVAYFFCKLYKSREFKQISEWVDVLRIDVKGLYLFLLDSEKLVDYVICFWLIEKIS